MASHKGPNKKQLVIRIICVVMAVLLIASSVLAIFELI